MRCSVWRWWFTVALGVAWHLQAHPTDAGKPGKQRPGVASNDSGDLLFSGRSPHDYGLRASPPEDIPIIIESPNKIYDPRPHDVNNTALRQQLGKQWDPKYMSVKRPKHLHLLQHEYDFPFEMNRKGRLEAIEPEALPTWLRDLRFRYIWLPDGSKARTTVSGAKLERKLQNYLWAHTSCPVVYHWRDIGRRFWPRWVKEGHCPQGKQSCSVPPGMTCQQAGKVEKPILRWHCQDWQTPRRCKWLKVQYPIVNRCKCMCPGHGGHQ